MRFKTYDLSNAAHKKAVKRGPAFVEVSPSGRIRFSKEAARLLTLQPDRKAGVTFGTDVDYPTDWYIFASEDKRAFQLSWAKNGRCSVTSNVLAGKILGDIGADKAVRIPVKYSEEASGLAMACRKVRAAGGEKS